MSLGTEAWARFLVAMDIVRGGHGYSKRWSNAADIEQLSGS